MITYSKIGKKGNLGNQLFQIASTIGLGVKNNIDFKFLNWKYQAYFKNQLPVLDLLPPDLIALEEKKYNYYERNLENKNYDSLGWLQTEKYFDQKLTKHYFEFSDVLKDKIKDLYSEAFKKKTILISIRRGDFVDHPDYFQLPVNYYLNSLIRFFPDWKSHNLVVLSDDIGYCKFHFSFLDNVFFGEALNDVEQLCLGSMCDDFIISNSTFSWWSAWLGEKEHSKIIRPLKNFDGPKSIELNDKDYFPERWTCYNHMNDRINLGNTVVAISKQNSIIEDYLRHNFTFKNENKIIKLDSSLIFDSDTKQQLLVIYDSILPPLLIVTAIDTPIDCLGYRKGKFLNISKYLDKQLFEKQFDYGFFSKILNRNTKSFNTLIFALLKTNKNQESFLTDNNISISNFHKKEFFVFYSYAGKIKGFPECKYYVNTQRQKLMVFLKSNIKAFIKPKRKI
jgi:hypothetical protein